MVISSRRHFVVIAPTAPKAVEFLGSLPQLAASGCYSFPLSVLDYRYGRLTHCDPNSSVHKYPPAIPFDRTKFRRRPSIAPLPAYRVNSKEMMANDLDSQSVITQNSMSSINSLASLLKEKMQV